MVEATVIIRPSSVEATSAAVMVWFGSVGLVEASRLPCLRRVWNAKRRAARRT